MCASSNNKMDSRSIQIYRIPVYQKRLTGTDDYISIPIARSPSPKTTMLASPRRHSTPSTSTIRFVELKSPQANTVIKYYFPHTKTARAIREENLISNTLDAVKFPRRPVSLLKRRHEDERVIRIATTPTGPAPNNDIVIPIAKKSRHTIIETPVNRDTLSRKQWKKRETVIPLDFERDISSYNDDFYGETYRNRTSEPKLYKVCGCCLRKCAHQFSACNFCQWYHNCPVCCWITCLLLALGLLIRIFVPFALSSG